MTSPKVHLQVRLDDRETISLVEDFRRSQETIPSVSADVRHLIAAGAAAEAAKNRRAKASLLNG